MLKNPLFDLYEKLYFHEIEVREKLGGRLQAPMAIIVSLVGLLGFLLQNLDKQQATAAANLTLVFVVFLVACATALLCAGYFFIRSWYGNTYAFLPTAEDTENYRKILESTYAEYKGGDNLAEKNLNDYLCSYYIKCSTQNTRCNDQRSLNLHKTNSTLIVATLLAVFSYLPFYFGDLDRSKVNKPTEVNIVNPIEIKGALMTDKKPEATKEVTPPPPPPPPPPRQIKEGVEILKPLQEKKDDK